MSPSEIEEFGKRKNILKASTRDLPVILSKGLWGATTVATTMIFAALAGIEVFVTGGIGGVHRGAETTFDISRDLQELANTNVTVVCAGAKAILDLPKTMEYLETMGVPVLGYKSKELGAFYSRESGLYVDYQMDSALEIAKGKDLDLVQISPNAVPSVCKVMDYGKYRFDQIKREKEARKRNKAQETKIIQLSLLFKQKISKSDILRIKLAKELISKKKSKKYLITWNPN